MYKLNKMCGIIMDKEKNKHFSEKKNIQNVKNKILDERSSSNGLFFLLNKTNKILNDYSEYNKCKKKIRKKEFKEMIKNTKKKYWDKFNLDKLTFHFSKNHNKDEYSNNDNTYI